jgi:putative tryptophan/tyrosine transport system permease protein
VSFDFFITSILQGLGYTSLALGVYLSLRIFNIPDITTDGSFTIGGAVTAVLLLASINPFLVLVAAVIAGMIAGIITGLIITKLKVQPLLAGILTMTALYSVNLALMGRSNIPLVNVADIYTITGLHSSNAFITVMLVAVLILIAKQYYILRTDFGIAMRATGNSEAMVSAMGVHTGNMKIAGLAIANGLTAFSGYLITQYQGFADINMGLGIVISGLGSVLIGEALFRKVKNNILYGLIAVAAGSIVFRMIIAAALAIGLNPNYLKLTTAVIVLLIVGITMNRSKK